MFTKLGFLVLILMFGTLAFMAGAMAPDGWRHAIHATGDELVTVLRTIATKVHPGATSPVTSEAPSHSTTAAPASSASHAPAPLHMDALTIKAAISAPAPQAGQPAYAVQLGQYVTEDEASLAAKRFQAQGVDLPFSNIAVVDDKQQAWTVLAAGRFTTPAAAHQAASRIESSLNLDTLPVIRLPPSTKPSS